MINWIKKFGKIPRVNRIAKPITRKALKVLDSGDSSLVSSASETMEISIRIPPAIKPRLPMITHKEIWGTVADNPSITPSFRGKPANSGSPAIQNIDRIMLIDITGYLLPRPRIFSKSRTSILPIRPDNANAQTPRLRPRGSKRA